MYFFRTLKKQNKNISDVIFLNDKNILNFKLREIFDNAMLRHSDLEGSVYEMNEEFDHPGSADSDRNDGG